MEKMIQLPEWHFKTIENALRLTNNVCHCQTKETAFDREVVKAYDYAKCALANVQTSEKDLRVCSVIVPVFDLSENRICLASKEFSNCEIHANNKFGCADCGNFKKEE